jgi:hypothetical protein
MLLDKIVYFAQPILDVNYYFKPVTANPNQKKAAHGTRKRLFSE